jgi:protein TonB
MRHALSGSALVHVGIIGVMLVGFAWPAAEDAAAPAPVNVSIIALSTVATNATEVVESDSTVSAVSAGSSVETLTPLAPEALEPVETSSEALEPRRVEPEQAVAEVVEPIEPPQELQELASNQLEALPSVPAAVAPVQVASIEPVSSENLNTAPVPQTLRFKRPSKPTARPQQAAKEAPRQSAPRQAGNGGQSQADAVASAGSAAAVSGQGSGGDAEIARYPSVVIGELRRALRRAGSGRGEVVVRFTVYASGQLADVTVGRSSGDQSVDAAGIATVQRAAPFPPIPTASGRDNWTFDVPLAFGG